MGIIITESVDLIECADGHRFLKEIFPSGVGEVFIGHLVLDQGQFRMDVHVYDKPAKDVAKWGIWGKNYNVVVIDLLGQGLKEIEIKHWEGFGRGALVCTKKEKIFSLHQHGAGWELKISFGILAFQKCSTYIDGEIEE